MDQTERVVSEFLAHEGFSSVVFEPDGNVPPDFLVDGRIAVEVRRLNQHEKHGATRRGLEETRIPLRTAVSRLLPALGSSLDGQSWWFLYTFSRPLPRLRKLRKKLRKQLEAFRAAPQNSEREFKVGDRFRVDLFRTGRTHNHCFVLGGYADLDAGGYKQAEMIRNIRICSVEKAHKVASVRRRYPEWWLCLVDHMSYGLSADDLVALREALSTEDNWEKLILVMRDDPECGYQLLGSGHPSDGLLLTSRMVDGL